MKNDFSATGSADNVVYVSDTDGTLFQVAGENFNHKLFELLIEAKQNGSEVFICSAADGAETSFALRLQLRKRGLPEDLFEIEHDLLDPANQPIIPKAFLAQIIEERGIKLVGFVFEDQKVDYLPECRYSQQIKPAAFVYAARQHSIEP